MADPDLQAWLQRSESWAKTYAAFKVRCVLNLYSFSLINYIH
jgi:hypothetical protein